MDLGAARFETFWKITFPIIRSGFITALLMGLIISLEDVIIAHFLAGTDTTAPVYILSALQKRTGLNVGLALSSFLIFLGLSIALVFYFVGEE